jgi:hypothetical protein
LLLGQEAAADDDNDVNHDKDDGDGDDTTCLDLSSAVTSVACASPLCKALIT